VGYASLSAVKARAGQLASGWTATSKPSDDDIEGFLADVAAELDALIGARGYAAPTAGSPAALALRNVNADGALVLALEATYPETSGPAAAGKTLDEARKRYEAAWGKIAEGKHPAFALLESAGASPSASSFWQSEPEFGTTSLPDARDRNPFTSAGPIGRGQRF
jgi:hypothetical protein